MMDNGGAHQERIMATKETCQETYDRAQTSARDIGELIRVLLEKKIAEDSTPEDVRKEIDDSFTSGLLEILQLREHHRELCLMVETIRGETAASKSELDLSSLHLQNLLYEKHHYQREIRSCQSYRSAYKDEEIELIPEEEFHRLDEEKVKLQAIDTAGMQVEIEEEKVEDQEDEEIEIEEVEKEFLSPGDPVEASQDPSGMDEEEIEEGEQLEIEDDGDEAYSGPSDRDVEKPGQEGHKRNGYTASVTVRDEAHELMLRRLQQEAELREEKREALQVLKEQRDALAAELAQQRNILNGIEVEVTKLKEYVLEAQKSFEVDQPQVEGDALSAFLPAPLFVLFTGLRAAAETACAPIAMEYNIQLSIDISGSSADMMKEKIKRMDMGSTATHEDEKESAALASLSKDLYPRDAKANEPYPLSVVIRASLTNQNEPLEFVFSFYPRLGCVLVSGSGERETSILQDVEKDSTELKIDPALEVPGHSFSWVQMISGIDLLPDGVFWSSDHPNTEVVSAIRLYQSERRSSSILTKLLDSIQATIE